MRSKHEPVVLSIAGSDPSGGAGLQADLKTFQALGVDGAAVVTALTVQDGRRVLEVHPVEARLVGAQIDAVLSGLGAPPAAVKVGMLASGATVEAVAEALHGCGPLVLDPVLAASDGTALLDAHGEVTLRETLLPRVDVLTPNLPEAARLLDASFDDVRGDPERACRELGALGPRAVLLKGGHADGSESEDVLWDGAGFTRLVAPRLAARDTHGSGCVLSSALAAQLARGADLAAAARAAKAFVTAAIEAANRGA
jgi:hydroxymethylpyrimidine/phosphomethylpyrimidine kinase